MNDKEILSLNIFDKFNKISSTKLISQLNKNNILKKYLETRYDYFNGSYGDVVKLIKDGYKEWPKCPTCGKIIKFPYNNDHCSISCSDLDPKVKNKKENTFLQKYGVKNPFQNKNIQEKYKNTMIKKYGKEHPSKCKIIENKKKQTSLKHYGVEYPFQSEVIKKKKEDSYLKHYGVKNPLQSEEVKEKIKKTCLEKYGVKWHIQSEDIKNKQYETKRKNGTFNTSKAEDEIYEKLLKIFKKKDIFRNYNKDSRYPFLVDFYIGSKDLFIECNFHWSHGGHWFDKNNKEDQKIIKEWKNKNSNYYNNAIDSWKRDVEKRDIANKNKLNYIVFWTKNDYDKWISKGCPNKFQNK